MQETTVRNNPEVMRESEDENSALGTESLNGGVDVLVDDEVDELESRDRDTVGGEDEDDEEDAVGGEDEDDEEDTVGGEDE